LNLNTDLQRALDEEGNIVPCQNAPDLFFSPDTEYDKRGATDYTHAKMLCAKCPIIEVCLNYALENNFTEGVWGGLTPAERRRMRQARVLP